MCSDREPNGGGDRLGSHRDHGEQGRRGRALTFFSEGRDPDYSHISAPRAKNERSLIIRGENDLARIGAHGDDGLDLAREDADDGDVAGLGVGYEKILR